MSASSRTATAIRFPEDLHEELAQAAKDRGIPINRIVVEAVRDFLPRMIPADQYGKLLP